MRPGLISAGEIAERLGIQCQTVYLWVRQRRIPFYRVGRLVKFDEAEVLARFKADVDDDDAPLAENDTLLVQSSRRLQSVKRIRISTNKEIDPRRSHGSSTSQTTEQCDRYRALLGMVK